MRQILNYKIFSAVLFCAMLWFGVQAIDAGMSKYHTRQELSELKSKVAGLERENQFLNRSGDYFKSEAFLERQARVKLNYKLAGEQVVFVYHSTASSQPLSFEDELRTMENYRKWWYYLLGR